MICYEIQTLVCARSYLWNAPHWLSADCRTKGQTIWIMVSSIHVPAPRISSAILNSQFSNLKKTLFHLRWHHRHWTCWQHGWYSFIHGKTSLFKIIIQIQPSNLFCLFRCTRGRQEREIARRKFRAAMKEDIIPKAAGMRFALGDQDQLKPTPRVIQALGKKILKIRTYLNLCRSIFL